MTTSNLYRLKYIDGDKIKFGDFAKLSLILYRLDQLLEQGMYCIVVDERGEEYKAPAMPSTKPPKSQKTVKPSPKPLMIDAIAAYMKKPENVARREKARLDDAAMWERLRSKN